MPRAQRRWHFWLWLLFGKSGMPRGFGALYGWRWLYACWFRLRRRCLRPRLSRCCWSCPPRCRIRRGQGKHRQPARQQPYRRVIPMYGARRQQHRFADDMSALYVRQFMAKHPFQKQAFTQGLRDQHHRTQHAHGHRARHGGIGIYPRCATHTHRPAGRGVSLPRRRAFHRPVPMERAGAPYRIMRKVPQRTYAHARQPHKAGQPRRRWKKDLS